MIDIEKRTYYLKLLDLYSSLLTQTQKQSTWLYLVEDLSFKEVSEILAVSRSAAFDAVKKSLLLLEQYEDKLSLNQKNNVLQKYYDDLVSLDIKAVNKIIDKIKIINENTK